MSWSKYNILLDLKSWKQWWYIGNKIFMYTCFGPNTPSFYAPDQKKNLKLFSAPYGLKEYRCKVSTIYLYYYKSYYKLQETSEVLCFCLINEFFIKEYLKMLPFDVRFFIFSPKFSDHPKERRGVNYEKYTPLPMG